MPVILRVDGLRVVIYPNDHRPAHVHVVGTGGEAVFILHFPLHCPGGPLELRESYGFERRRVTRIAAELAAELPALCLAWRRIHDGR